MKKQTLVELIPVLKPITKAQMNQLKGGIGNDDIEAGITNTDLGGI